MCTASEPICDIISAQPQLGYKGGADPTPWSHRSLLAPNQITVSNSTTLKPCKALVANTGAGNCGLTSGITTGAGDSHLFTAKRVASHCLTVDAASPCSSLRLLALETKEGMNMSTSGENVSEEAAKRDAAVLPIASMRLFVEPPSWLASARYAVTGLPHDFFEIADKKLELDGELINWAKEHGGALRVENIPRIADSDGQAFFSQQAKSDLWRVFYGSGASGERYSVLVELKVREAQCFQSEEHRRLVYAEYEELLDKAMIEDTLHCLNLGYEPASEDVLDQAMRSASRDVMWKHRISKKEMGHIILEGGSKWAKLTFQE